MIKEGVKEKSKGSFTFIDLFAGIGGFRLALQNHGGKCTFSSEWDIDAKKTYYSNFGEFPFGDITQDHTQNNIPDKFDILCGGFPCQPFSIAGYRKGFDDIRGTLFFSVAQIVEKHKPKVVFLENVKNLYTHDNGNTFKTIINVLELELGYKVFSKVMNSMEYANIPQNRERVFFVCFDPLQVQNYSDFSFPQPIKLTNTIHHCIDASIDDEFYFYRENKKNYSELKNLIVSKDTVYQWRRHYVRENKNFVCPTLTANMGTGGHNVPLILTDKGIRKLTPYECLKFQGFPSDFEFGQIAVAKKYQQAGNSVTLPLIERIVAQILEVL